MSRSLVFRTVAHCFRTLSLVVFDLVRLAFLAAHSRSALAVENLFLRKQLALVQERKVKPRRADDSTRWVMATLSRIFQWRDELVNRFVGGLGASLYGEPIEPNKTTAHRNVPRVATVPGPNWLRRANGFLWSIKRRPVCPDRALKLYSPHPGAVYTPDVALYTAVNRLPSNTTPDSG